MELVSTLLHHSDAELVDPLVNKRTPNPIMYQIIICMRNDIGSGVCALRQDNEEQLDMLPAQSQTYIMKVRPLGQDNEEQLNEQLDMLPALCRFQLQPASSYIMTLCEPSANRYAQVTRSYSKLTRGYS